MNLKNQIFAIDHHHGQASRTVLSGYPFIRGAALRDKAAYYLDTMSWVHESLIREPRGHRNMLGSIITAPVDDGCAFGVLFLHAYGLFDGCGDSTFATATAALETGMIEMTEPVTRFSIDTVLGPLHIEADVAGGRVGEVRFENVPSYRVGDIVIDLANHGSLTLQVAFGGLYYGFIDARAAGVEVAASAEQEIIAVARQVFAATGETFDMLDPQTGQPVPLDLITFVHKDAEQPNSYTVANVYRPGRMGRTPSGTGSCAHIALRAALGEYTPGDRFTQRSIVGTTFTGNADICTLPNGAQGVRPTIGTKSYMMAVSQFVIDPADPFGRGFVLES